MAEQLQVALNARSSLEQAKRALMQRERLDDRQAFIDLLRAARSSRPVFPEVATETVAGPALPHSGAESAGAAVDGAHQLHVGALDGEVAAFLEREPGADGGIGQKLSLVLLGFLATEVVPLADRLAGLGIDPTPVFAATSGILRLYVDTLEHPHPPR